MAPFQLNFNSDKKSISITLKEEDGIFDLALLFKKLLDDAGIENTMVETVNEEVAEAVETSQLD